MKEELIIEIKELIKSDKNDSFEINPIYLDYFSLEEKAILMNITKDTGFKIEHWQCSNKPGYKIVDLNVDGKVHIFGDAGSWSGPYGNWVSIRECIRYYSHV